VSIARLRSSPCIDAGKNIRCRRISLVAEELIDVRKCDHIAGTPSSRIETITSGDHSCQRLLLQILSHSGNIEHGINAKWAEESWIANARAL
jgi:hypothetical protein